MTPPRNIIPRTESEGYANQHTGFQNLMRHRIHEILLVSSLYDSFILAQDGSLNELILGEFVELNLYHSPGITRVQNGAEAMEKLRHGPRFNIIITSPNLGDIPVVEFVQQLKEEGWRLPVVLLTFDERELADLMQDNKTALFDNVFVWQGDFRILLTIVKLCEDRLNIDHDTRIMGVPAILLVEDNIHFYSSYLPMIYSEVMQHSQGLLSDSLNLPHRLLRMRARPKILHYRTFEEAWDAYTRYEDHILGVITDVEFMRDGVKNPDAGAELTEMVKARRPELPIMLQSFQEANAVVAEKLGVSFIRKDSRTLLHDLQTFMRRNFGFGDFIFRDRSGAEISRANDLRSLEACLKTIPDESLLFHGESDHFSTWLKARTEFALARKLKPRKVSDYDTPSDLRTDLVSCIHEFRRSLTRGVVTDFDASKFDYTSDFARIGQGSLGGKARGLAFISRLIEVGDLRDLFKNVRIAIPPTIVLCTDIFDRFIEENQLLDFALQTDNDFELEKRFLKARFPRKVETVLRKMLRKLKCPLAIRSSSLLEDSQYQPFAGIYQTFMIPNNHPDIETRLRDLIEAIKRIYISTFSNLTKQYIEATSYRLEEESMAVIIQRVVGSHHGERFYPAFSGVAKSHNFYPSEPMKPSDGVAYAALGLGRTITEGHAAVRFCPKYPRHLMQFGTTRDMLENTQKTFYALDLKGDEKPRVGQTRLESVSYGLDVAEQDNTLHLIGSVYSPDNDAIYDGLSRDGVRIVTFAPVLKHTLFPLPEICSTLLDMGQKGMGRPVEVEFAVNYFPTGNRPKEFVLLQMRPMVLDNELEELTIENVPGENLVCSSSKVLGIGKVDDIRDIVMVDINRFDRSKSRKVADEVGFLNSKLRTTQTPYLLVGVGRWGTADPWLGIPATWGQINGAKVIIETGFKDFKVTPSQGAHFFQNLTALRIGYFTVNPDAGEGFLDWDWLYAQPVEEKSESVSHIRLDSPLGITMNGHRNQGIIVKPGKSPNSE